MGLLMSLMGKGLPSTPVLNQSMGILYRQLVDGSEIDNFEKFRATIHEIFSTFNSALPGKHYDAPSREEIEKFYEEWQECEKASTVEEKERQKRAAFENFMKKHVKPSKPDTVTMITGIATPPVAMAAKRAGENTPPLKMMKFIPDVVFVPSVTVLTIATAKVTRRVMAGKTVHPSSKKT